MQKTEHVTIKKDSNASILFLFPTRDPGVSLPPPSSAWPPASTDKAPYLELSATPRINPDMQPKRKEFWETYVPEVVESVENAIEESKDPDAEAEPEPEPGPYFIATWVLVALLVFLLVLMLVLLVVVYKTKRDSYDMNNEGTVKYVAK